MPSILAMIFNTPQLVSLADADGNTIISFDATLSVDYNMSATLTKSQIETGESISDHVTLDNKKATFEIVVSNTPLNYAQIFAGLFTGANGNRARDAFSVLELLRDNAIPFNAVFEYRTFTNAIITAFDPQSKASHGGALHARITIEEAKIAETQMVEYAVVAAPATKNVAAKAQDRGKQATVPIPAAPGSLVYKGAQLILGNTLLP